MNVKCWCEGNSIKCKPKAHPKDLLVRWLLRRGFRALKRHAKDTAKVQLEAFRTKLREPPRGISLELRRNELRIFLHYHYWFENPFPVKLDIGYCKGLSKAPKRAKEPLWLLWSFSTGVSAPSLAFSEEGSLGVASGGTCAYVLDPNGHLLSSFCGLGSVYGTSYCCKRFGFVSDDGNVYIYDLVKREWKSIELEEVSLPALASYSRGITMLQDGFLASWFNLAYFDFEGRMKWKAELRYVLKGPAIHKGYAFVPRVSWPSYDKGALSVVKLSSGEEVRTLLFDSSLAQTKVWNNYLPAIAKNGLYLYDVSSPESPRLLWSSRLGGVEVAFSPDCNYLIVAKLRSKGIAIVRIDGTKVLERKLSEWVDSVSWWNERIALGLFNGTVYCLEASL